MSDTYNPAPVLSTATEFERVAQTVRKPGTKMSPEQANSLFSLPDVAETIYQKLVSGKWCEDSTLCGKIDTCKPECDSQKPCTSVGTRSEGLAQKGSVALQFPDSLIPESAYISYLLTEELKKVYEFHGEKLTADNKPVPPRLYVLGDTSYSPCCVDVVAAQHVNASVLVHFGIACLNNVYGMDVIYVFGKENPQFSLDSLEEMINRTYEESEDEIETVVFIYDPEYEYQLKDFVQTRFSKEKVGNKKYVVYDTQLKRPTDQSIIIPDIKKSYHSQNDDKRTEKDDDTSLKIPGYDILSKTLISVDDFMEKGSIFYLTHGTPSPSILLHLTTLAQNIQVIDGTDSKSTPNTPRMSLQYRYRNMNIARMAGTIGILVNTLSIRDLSEAVSHVQSWITDAGKKYYTFVVGKPNVAKLANFDVIDVWVVLGCSRGGMIMSSTGGADPDYNKPIITPYELKLALMSTPTWTGKWFIEFENVINNMKNVGLAGEKEEEDNDSQSEQDDDESEAPVFDPVTGRLVSNSRPLHTRRITHLDVKQENNNENNHIQTSSSNSTDSKGLVVKHSSHLVIRNTVSTAADYVYNKLTWTGLGSDFNQQDTDSEDEEGKNDGSKKEKRFATVEKGRGGVARSYGIVGQDK